MDQVLPGYAEECRLMSNKSNPQLFYYPLDDISSSYDFNNGGLAVANTTTIGHNNVIFPGDHDNMSLYFSHNRKGVIALGEGERRKLRRERNKVAASKCRNKRKEHVQTLLKESDELELRNKQVELDIAHLQLQIKELEAILDTHRCYSSGRSERSSNSTPSPL